MIQWNYLELFLMNNPANTRHRGVGIFYITTLPVSQKWFVFRWINRSWIKMWSKNNFFTVLYRNPTSNRSSPEFQTFLANFENLYSKFKAEKPLATFFYRWFQCSFRVLVVWRWYNSGRYTTWRTLYPTRSISDQPNLILDSGTRPALDPFSHHQIIYGKINFSFPPPPPAAITKSMISLPWLQHFSLSPDPNWQVKTFTDIFLNIMSTFMPNEIKRCSPHEPPWITNRLKTLLNKKNRLHNNYKSHCYKAEDKVRLDAFRIECQQAVEMAKLSYLPNLGDKLNNPNTSQKSHWKIINRVMNKCRAPKIPPLLVNNLFILNCKEKAKYFNDFFFTTNPC